MGYLPISRAVASVKEARGHLFSAGADPGIALGGKSSARVSRCRMRRGGGVSGVSNPLPTGGGV